MKASINVTGGIIREGSIDMEDYHENLGSRIGAASVAERAARKAKLRKGCPPIQ